MQAEGVVAPGGLQFRRLEYYLNEQWRPESLGPLTDDKQLIVVQDESRLAAALRDPFWVSFGDIGPPRRVYGIRITARGSLLRIKASGILLPPEVQRALNNVVTEEPISPAEASKATGGY